MLMEQYQPHREDQGLRRLLVAYGAVVACFCLLFAGGGLWYLSSINAPGYAERRLLKIAERNAAALPRDQILQAEMQLQEDLELTLAQALTADDLEFVPENRIARVLPDSSQTIAMAPVYDTAPMEAAEDMTMSMKSAPATETAATGEIDLSEGAIAVPANVIRVLRYTNSEGKLVYLGLDANSLPIYKKTED